MDKKKDKIDAFMLDVLVSIEGINKSLYEAIEYVIRTGGKRVRGRLMIKICELLGVEQSEALICATAIEMIHNYSLIHDDLPSMDDDDFRRGFPSCHNKFGEGMAILAGNSFYTLALQLLIDGLNRDILPDVIRTVVNNSGVTGLLSGQAIDLLKINNAVESNDDLKSLIDLYYLKTGKLFEATFVIPAILSNCDSETTQALAEGGGVFGVLYQLSDDLADGDVNEDMALELHESLLSRFYSCIDSINDRNLSEIKSLAREMLDFQ